MTMVTITLLGQEKTMKNEISEFSLTEFEEICFASKNNDDYIERYVDIFKLLGMTEDELDSMDVDEFLTLTKKFHLAKWDMTTFTPTIEIDGVTYTAFTGDKYKLSVRDLAKIETYIKKNDRKFLAEMLAVVYKDLTQSKEVHYSDEHITKKAKLFREHVKADIALPYVNLILNKVMMKLTSEAGQ